MEEHKMKLRRSRLLLSVAVLALVPLFGPAASMQQAWQSACPSARS
jgi:hypothetical protein